jgi:hypothetical protein
MPRLIEHHAFLVLCLTLGLAGCDDEGYVGKSKYDALQRQLNDAREELRKAKQEIAQRPAHKYELFHRGIRTWRFDAVDGTTCILLTTKTDWKSPETAKRACPDPYYVDEEGNIIAR